MDLGLGGFIGFFLLDAPLVDVGGTAYFLPERAAGACKLADYPLKLLLLVLSYELHLWL